MTSMLASRRRLIRAKGRAATLRRQTGVDPVTYTTVAVSAVFTGWNPADPRNGLAQNERRVEILADDITAAGWPGPPRQGDSLVSAEGDNAIIGAQPVYDGAVLIGYTMLERGA